MSTLTGRRDRRSVARRIAAWLPIAGMLGLIASCAVGPDYKRPPFATAPAYKEEDGMEAERAERRA